MPFICGVGVYTTLPNFVCATNSNSKKGHVWEPLEFWMLFLYVGLVGIYTFALLLARCSSRRNWLVKQPVSMGGRNCKRRTWVAFSQSIKTISYCSYCCSCDLVLGRCSWVCVPNGNCWKLRTWKCRPLVLDRCHWATDLDPDSRMQ